MKKFLWAIALISLVPAIGAAALIVAGLTNFESIKALRMAMVNIYSGMPAAIVRLDLNRALRDRDFQRALKELRHQKSIAEAIGFTGFMRHDLIENSSQAVEVARLSGAENQFLDWALELREIAPMDYLGLTLLSRIQTRNNAEAAIDAAKKARNALPVDETSYRALIQRGFRVDDADQIATNCQLYAKAQIGAFDPRYAPTASLVGQGIRTLALAFDGDATEPSYAISQGMKLGQPARNIFDVKSDDDSPLMRLIIPSVPGLKLRFEGLIFHTFTGVQRFAPDQLRIIPTYGYALSRNEFLITSNFGEAFLIRPESDSFPRATQVELEYSILRLALANDPACLAGRT